MLMHGDYIIARYELETPEKTACVKTASKSLWEVLVNEKTSQINLFYKGYQVAKFAASSLGIKKEDLADVQKYLPAKLATSKELTKALLKGLSSSERYQACRQFPELSEVAKWNQISKTAEALLTYINDNEQMSLSSFAYKLAQASKQYPEDQTMGVMTGVIDRMSKSSNTITRKEIKDLYSKLYSRNTKFASIFSNELGLIIQAE